MRSTPWPTADPLDNRAHNHALSDQARAASRPKQRTALSRPAVSDHAGCRVGCGAFWSAFLSVARGVQRTIKCRSGHVERSDPGPHLLRWTIATDPECKRGNRTVVERRPTLVSSARSCTFRRGWAAIAATGLLVGLVACGDDATVDLAERPTTSSVTSSVPPSIDISAAATSTVTDATAPSTVASGGDCTVSADSEADSLPLGLRSEIEIGGWARLHWAVVDAVKFAAVQPESGVWSATVVHPTWLTGPPTDVSDVVTFFGNSEPSIPDGATILVGISPDYPDTLAKLILLTDRGEGVAATIVGGLCADDELTAALRQMAVDVDAAVGLITRDPDRLLSNTSTTVPTTWEDRDWWQRSILPGETPDDVLEPLIRVTLYARLPADYQPGSLGETPSLCSRIVDVGTNMCFTLSSGSSGYAGPIPIAVSSTSAFELTVADEAGTWASQQVIGHFDMATALAQLDQAGSVLGIDIAELTVTDGEVTSIDGSFGVYDQSDPDNPVELHRIGKISSG
jgi:hypothetical protein